MDESWLRVADAAEELGVSSQRVRELLASGSITGRKLGVSWFVDPVSVQRRARQGGRSGRPLSAGNAWRVLAVLESATAERQEVLLSPSVNAVDRSRLRVLLADLPDADGLARRLAGRVTIRRMRAHPAAFDRLISEEGRVSVGGGHAIAALGGGVAAGGVLRVYVPAVDVDIVVERSRLRDDVEGNVELAVVPSEVDPDLIPEPGVPVPLAVAWVDLLGDPDPRARGAAREWVARLPRSLSVADGRRR